MDIRAVMNRAKTRVRYFLVSDLWIKKVIPASFRHRFSNRVIDTKEMALNHLPGRRNYTLDALSEHLGIAVKTDSELETICRKTWKWYCRMERSDL